MKVTNNSAAMQGIHTLHGIVFLKPGEARDNLDLSEGQARRAGRLKFLELKGEPSKDVSEVPATASGLDIPPNEVDQLRRQIEEKDAEIERLNGLLATRGREPEGQKGDEIDRDDLKKQAKELGIDHAANIPSAKLKELIDAKLAS